MHAEPTGESPIEQAHGSDWNVLVTLLTENQTPWTADELARGLGGVTIAVVDSLDRLERGGLIRRTTDGLVFPTRAAVYFDQLNT